MPTKGGKSQRQIFGQQVLQLYPGQQGISIGLILLPFITIVTSKLHIMISYGYNNY